MGSGHNKSGRGNSRRPRNGPPQRGGRGPQHMNGQRNGQSPAIAAISPRLQQSQPGAAPSPTTYEAEADLDVVEVDEVVVAEGDGEVTVVEVREVTGSFNLSAGDPPAAGPPPPAPEPVGEDGAPARADRPVAPPSRGQRQPYVPAMSAGRQGPPPPQVRPHAQGASLVAPPADARRPPSRPAVVDGGDSAESAPPQQSGPRPRPERFAVADRPHRDHGERYQHIPGTPDVRGEVGSLIDSLRTLFQADRATASQSGAARCGICYFHFPLSVLVYREDDGFYACQQCAHALGGAPLHMVRRQQRH